MSVKKLWICVLVMAEFRIAVQFLKQVEQKYSKLLVLQSCACDNGHSTDFVPYLRLLILGSPRLDDEPLELAVIGLNICKGWNEDIIGHLKVEPEHLARPDPCGGEGEVAGRGALLRLVLVPGRHGAAGGVRGAHGVGGDRGGQGGDHQHCQEARHGAWNRGIEPVLPGPALLVQVWREKEGCLG